MNARFPFVILIFLAVATVHGENPAPAPAEDPLGAARRDLSALSATEKAREGSAKLPGSASVPQLAIPSGSEAAPSKPDEPGTSSPTWLLDALAQTDAERSQRRVRADGTSVPPVSDTARKSQPTDPLAQYLGQWMTPRDLSLLRPEFANTPHTAGNGTDLTSSQTADPVGLVGMQRGASSLMAEPAKNPYLQEPEEPLPGVDATAVRGGTRVLAPVASQTAEVQSLQTIDPSAKADLRKPSTTAVEPAEVSPAAPIINTGKYFPQLRRF